MRHHFTVVSVLASLFVSTQAFGADSLGGAGESCRATSDCEAALKCVSLTCVARTAPASHTVDASNPDTRVVLKPKFGGRFGFLFDAGPSVSIIKTGARDESVVGIAPHVQTNLFFGHRVMSDSTMWIGLGYRGSAEISDQEMFQRHGLGLTVAAKWVHAVGMVGGNYGFTYAGGTPIGGFSIGGALGVRLGPVSLNAPVYLDLVPVSGQLVNITTFSFTMGVAL